MTSVDGVSRPQPGRALSSSSRPDPAPADVRAMRDALAAARGRVDTVADQGGRKPLTQGSGKAPHGSSRSPAPTGQDGRWAAEARSTGEEVVAKPHARQDADTVGAWSGQGAGLAPGATVTDFPAAHVDAGAFAQMLADLWTRENGRGAKEVRVRFGDRAWPATGARLMRNAAGALDVALFVGDGGRAYGDKLAGLEDALTSAGVDLGSLAVVSDD